MSDHYAAVLDALSTYLQKEGWKLCTNTESQCFLQWADPKTGMHHRTDFAFFIASEREKVPLSE